MRVEQSGSSFCSAPKKSERMLIIARSRGSRKTLRKDFRETPALALLGAHVKLLALVDIQEEGRRLGLAQFR